MENAALIIFVKNPILGRAKTRLAKTIGDDKALAIYKKLLEKTCAVVTPLKADIHVYYNDFIDRDDIWDNQRFHKYLQVDDDLGMKMFCAFEQVFERGYQKVCVIGSDCWDLKTEYLESAFEALDENHIAIGPSFDGGYYLLGMKKLEKSLFDNKQWSTPSVFNDTLADIHRLGWAAYQLPKISDVDVEEDLGEWAQEILEL